MIENRKKKNRPEITIVLKKLNDGNTIYLPPKNQVA
jgi:hypothetical protein